MFEIPKLGKKLTSMNKRSLQMKMLKNVSIDLHRKHIFVEENF